MKNSFTYSGRTYRPMSYKTVKFNRKPIVITGNLATLIALLSVTITTMTLFNIFG